MGLVLPKVPLSAAASFVDQAPCRTLSAYGRQVLPEKWLAASFDVDLGVKTSHMVYLDQEA